MSWSEDWNPFKQKYIFRSGYWDLAYQTLDVRCVRTNYSSFEPLQFILYRTASHIGTKRYRVLCRHGQRWKKNYLLLARGRANWFIQAGYASYVRDKFWDLLDKHIHISEPAWIITKCQKLNQSYFNKWRPSHTRLASSIPYIFLNFIYLWITPF